MPMLRAGASYDSPSRFPVPFLATPQQRSMQGSMIPYGGKPATLQYDHLSDRGDKLIQYKTEKSQSIPAHRISLHLDFSASGFY